MRHLGVALALLMLGIGVHAQGVSGLMGNPPHEPRPRSAGLVETTMTIDDLYRQLLKTREGLHEVWKQQPGNLAGLKKYTDQLRREITTLSETLGKTESTARPSSSEKLKSGDSVIRPPSGPVGPSQEPSTEENLERQRKATLEKFLPSGPQNDQQEPRSLVGVPEGWLQQSLLHAMREIASLEGLLEAQPPDRSAVEHSLMELKTIFHHMGNPPQTVLPVAPKDSR